MFSENYNTANNKNILTFVYWFVLWTVLDNLMDHGGHASFVDYDGQVFIPILNITFPFWSAFYCTIAQITYLQNQAQKHNADWQKKMILGLLFISKCYLKMIVDWAEAICPQRALHSVKLWSNFVGFCDAWWSLVMKTELQIARAANPVQFLSPGPGLARIQIQMWQKNCRKEKPGRESRDKNAGPHDEYIISLVRMVWHGC